jgi:hypothetical protein
VPGQQLACPPCQACDQASGTCAGDPSQAGHACPGNGDLCFGSFTCDQGGSCTGVNPVTCTALDSCHVAGTCAPATGLCSNPNAPDGTACTDGDLCTTCQAGVCTDVTCEGVACAFASCNPASGCVFVPVDEDCTSPSPCFNAVCDLVQGCILVPIDCDDGNPCTADSCFGGNCIHTPLDLCNDGLKCTTDVCTPDPSAPQGYVCSYVFNPSNCGTYPPCQTPLCGPDQDCVFTYDNTKCPPYPNGVTCLVPLCAETGCTYEDICISSQDPNCAGCPDCSCNIATNQCISTCPS